MLEPQSTISIPTDTSKIQLAAGDDALTEGYGDIPPSTRNLGGSVDFFSTLGSERQKKPQNERPNPDKACRIISLFRHLLTISLSFKSVLGN